MTPSRTSSSSTLRPAAARDSDAGSIRPRNRRFLSTQDDAGSSSALSSPSRSPSRGASPIPAARIGSVTGRNNPKTDVVRGTSRRESPSAGGGLLGGSWTPSWASVQELASSLLTSGASAITGESNRPRGGEGSRAGKQGRQAGQRNGTRDKTWGPEPPDQGRPCADDIAAGSRAEREAALRALRTASVLESHDGVNGGLDTARRFKRRNSDEDLRSASANQEAEEYLAYIHHVQATDTYAGIVLKYRCREDAFRKANGLWSRDNVQVRKWLAIPVDACEVKGRPCDPPTSRSPRVDLLSRTPDATDPFGRDGSQQTHDDFFSTTSPNGHAPERNQAGDEEKPWTHVRWVSIDSHPHPVEVARVPRKALGYFPPRRKKSAHTMSAISTPRASTDLPSVAVSDSATWLRGAFERARQGPLTPVLGPSRGTAAGGDLIELADTGTEDGRQQSEGPLSELRGLFSALPGAASRSTSPSPAFSSSGSRPAQWTAGVRGRGAAASGGDKKAD
ncbi:hypothetical protein L209DRAFT_740404 [Thermothelomyces heterothallicus CBS 203.75]